jgi:hypothetical protein
MTAALPHVRGQSRGPVSRWAAWRYIRHVRHSMRFTSVSPSLASSRSTAAAIMASSSASVIFGGGRFPTGPGCHGGAGQGAAGVGLCGPGERQGAAGEGTAAPAGVGLWAAGAGGVPWGWRQGTGDAGTVAATGVGLWELGARSGPDPAGAPVQAARNTVAATMAQVRVMAPRVSHRRLRRDWGARPPLG